MYNRTDKNIVSQSKKRRHKIVGTVIKVNGHTVGQVIGDTFVKDITNRHMLTTPPAIANDIQALHDAERAGALYCEFTNTDTGIIYRASINKIWAVGWLMNLGYGDQQALTLHNWTQTIDPEFASHTDTMTPEYSDANSTHDEDIMPLNIKRHAPKGTKFTKGKTKQLRMFGNEGRYE